MDPMGIYLPTCTTNMLSYLGSTSHPRMTKASKMLGGKGVDPNYTWAMKKRAPGWLGYIGDYTTQVYRD